MNTYRLSGSPRAIARVLGTIILCLLFANAVGLFFRFGTGHDQVFGLVPLFNVDVEGNIPSFFSVCLTLCAAALFGLIGFEASSRASREAGFWYALAAGFVFLAYDEGFQVHEQMTAPLRAMMGGSNLGFFYFGWVVPGLLGVAVVGLFFLRFTLRLPPATRRRLYTAAALFVGGCIGMELINGKVMESQGKTLFYHVLVMVEEGLEMAGMATLVHAQASHIAEASDKVELDLHADAPQRVAGAGIPSPTRARA